MKITNSSPFIVVLALLSLWFSPKVQAVAPPPDGGYPGGNTAEGQSALLSLTTGGFNTAVGWSSLESNVDTSFNTAVGAGTLLFNTAAENTAIGAAALLFNTTGSGNTAVGVTALLNNTEGGFNTATGAFALQSNTTGIFNTATGAGALENNTDGRSNTVSGAFALLHNTEGFQNTAVGREALFSKVVGANNTATGFQALKANTTGGFNTAIGLNALVNNIGGSSNTALGDSAGFNVTTANHVICIGANVQGENVSNTCYIGNVFGTTSADGTAVFVNANGKLGTNLSSQRFKDDIKPMDQDSEALFELKPVTFCYKKEIDPEGAAQFGLVAEDVEKINPDLIIRDREGKPHTVRYEQINAMLLNEFIKEHRTVQQLKMEIAALTATVQEPAAQLYKVNTQLQLTNAAQQIVVQHP